MKRSIPNQALLGRAMLAFILTAVVLLLGLTPLTQAPDHGALANDDPRLSKAHEHYMQAEFDEALKLLQALTEEQSLAPDQRRETFRLLGMVYTIMDQEPEAMQAIKDWIALEPPLVEADPDQDLLDFVHLYYEARKEVNQDRYCGTDAELPHPCQYGMEQPDPGIKTIAIIDFDNNSIDDHERLEPLRTGLADLMIRQLNGATGLEIVERERLDWLMNEIDLSQSGRVSTETAVRIGRLIGAHSVLLGDYMYLDKKLTIGARMVEVETSKILLTASEKGKLNDFTDVAGKLSEKLAQAIGVNIARQEWEEHTPTNSLEALMAYADGLKLYDQGNYKRADEKFMEALDHDPNYQKAQQKHEALRPMLANANE